MLFVLFVLASCTQVPSGPGQGPDAPYPSENMHDRGGDGGGGGGGM
jgi:hypothetical protein